MTAKTDLTTATATVDLVCMGIGRNFGRDSSYFKDSKENYEDHLVGETDCKLSTEMRRVASS